MWFTALVSALFFQFAIFQMTLFNSISSILMKQLHLSTTQFGVIASLYFYIAAISLIPAGFLLDKYNIKRIICAIFFLNLLTLIWVYLEPSIISLCFYRLLSGLSNTVAFVALMKIISKVFSGKKLNIVTSLSIALGMLGGVLQAPFGILINNIGWHHAMLIAIAAGSCYWLFMLFGIQERLIINTRVNQKLPSFTAMKNIFCSLINWQCGLYTGLLNVPVTVLAAVWGNMYLIQVKHYSAPQASTIISMIFIGMIIGSPLVAWLSTQVFSRKITMLLGAILALMIISGIMLPWQLTFLQMAVFFGLLGVFSTTQILSYPIVTEVNPLHYTGTAMSFVSVLIYLIGAGFSSLFGVIADMPAGSLTMAVLLLPIAFGIGIGIALFLREPSTKSSI